MISPPQVTLFEELSIAIGEQGQRGVQLVAFTPEFAQFALSDGSALVLLRHLPGDDGRLERMVLRVCEGLKRGTLYLVATGGDSGARDVLVAGQPDARFGVKVHIFAIDEQRQVWTGPNSKLVSELRAAFDRVSRPLGITARDFESWLQSQRAATQRLRAEVESYNRTMMNRKPWATGVLLGLIVFVYLLEWAFGGPESVTTLVRMGAMVTEGPGVSEPWRMFSHSFLHAGLMHIAGNGLILWMLGGFLERLLGPWRLLSLWAASVYFGALASTIAPSGAMVLVGASGGGWGLMGAAGVLAMRPRGLIPEGLARNLKRSIGQVLAINLFISFLPGIALAAHLGGGAGGALLMASGLSTLGLKPPAQRQRSDHLSTGTLVTMIAGLCAAALLFSSLGLALSRGQAWELTIPPHWERQELGDTGISTELPSSLPPAVVREESGGLSYAYGHRLSDPLRVDFLVLHPESDAPAGREGLSPTVLSEFALIVASHVREELPDGIERLQVSSTKEEADPGRFDEAFTLPGGGRLWRHTQLLGDRILIVNVLADEREGTQRRPWKDRIIENIEVDVLP